LAYEITFDTSDKRTVVATDPMPSESPTGTTVTIANPVGKLSTLEYDTVKGELTESFALYLRQYPDVDLTYDGVTIRPDELISRSTDIAFDFTTESGDLFPQVLTVIEWKVPLPRALFLCSSDGFSFRDTLLGIQAPGLNFTAYLRSTFLELLESQNAIEIELGDLGKLLEVTREKLRDYNVARQAQQTALQVEEWKQEEIYPYQGAAEDYIEAAKRQMFDVVAQNVSKYLPEFKTSKKKSKQLTFNLLRQAIETSPSSLRKILEEVIGLPSCLWCN
jgi:hypothetical protein